MGARKSNDQGNVIHVLFGSGGGRLPRSPVSTTAPSFGSAHRGRDPMAECYSAAEVAKLFRIKPSRLRYWERSGFLRPSAPSGARRYTFQDLIGVRVAKGLLDGGIALRSVRRSLDALRRSLPKVTQPLSELRVVADGARVLVQEGAASFEPVTGQLVLDFHVKSLRDDVVGLLGQPSGTPERRKAAFDHYLEGCRLDENERTFDAAEKAYRQAMALDPSLSNAVTNLGNLCFRRGSVAEAETLYRQALRVDGNQPEAHYNLGFLFFERNDVAAAARHFESAIKSDPSFADAHFNLAMTFEELGRHADARGHWSAYLKLDPGGAWSEIARRHLRIQR